MPKQKIRVFIVSNTKTKEWVIAFIDEVLDSAENDNGCKVFDIEIIKWWDSTVFEQGDSTLTSLFKEAEKSDFCVCFLTEDKVIITSTENEELKAPSHNCIFELGIFTTSIGRDRCLILCSFKAEDLGRVFSDYRGQNYAKINSENIKNTLYLSAKKLLKLIKEKQARQRIEPLPLITIEQLNDLETNNKNVPNRAKVIVNASQPLELDHRFAKRVLNNIIKNEVEYHYFFAINKRDTNEIEQIVQLFRTLATVNLENENPLPWSDRDKIEANLNNLQKYVRIYLIGDTQPIEFCIHNASRTNEAICYLRRPIENTTKFVEWTRGSKAYKIASNLFALQINSGKNPEKNYIFRATKDINLYRTIKRNKKQCLNPIFENLKRELANFFPADLEPIIKQVCFNEESG